MKIKLNFTNKVATVFEDEENERLYIFYVNKNGNTHSIVIPFEILKWWEETG